jgi:hypothetical protein
MFKIKFPLLVITLLVTSSLLAQLKEHDNLLGVSLGFWPKGSVPTFGVNFENQLTQAGIGTISIGGVFRYYAYTNTYSNGDSRKYTFTTFGVQSNYNFNEIGDRKFVPFLGLVLGYNNINQTYTDVTGHGVYVSNIAYSSGAWLWAQAGLRYFFSPNVAGSVRLGFGTFDFNELELGVDFKL